MAEEPDTPLTIALAEYEHLREASRAIDEQTTARFTFFLTVATAATAVSAGMVTTGTPAGAVRPTVLAGLGALVLMLGGAVFARQVELNARGRRYAVAATVLRTYLARRAPDLAPYLMMPTLDDPGPFAPEPFRRHWARDLVGQAGTIGLINSVVVAVAAGAGLAAVAPGWLAVAGAVAALAGSVAAHLVVVRRRVAQSARLVGDVLQRRTTLRPADGTTPHPADDAVHESFARG